MVDHHLRRHGAQGGTFESTVEREEGAPGSFHPAGQPCPQNLQGLQPDTDGGLYTLCLNS